ncbi:MAG: hypothetical protein ACYDBB_10535 [Armatimonadota bacterium]
MGLTLQTGEAILKQGKANKFSLFVSQGGELTLTDRRLVFTGHGVNIGNDQFSVALARLCLLD